MKRSIRFKLALLSVIPLLFYIATSAFLLHQQRQLYDVMTEEVNKISTEVQTLVLNADRDLYQAYVAYLRLESGQLNNNQLLSAREEWVANKRQVDERMGAAIAIIESEGLSDLQYGESGRALGLLLEQFTDQYARWAATVEQELSDESWAINDLAHSGFALTRANIDEIGDNIDAHVRHKMTEIQQSLTYTEWLLIAVLAGIVILVGIIGVLMIRRIMSTVRTVMSKTRTVAEGDLTAPPETHYTKDELGETALSLDQMIAGIKGLVVEISTHAQVVGQSANHLSDSSKESADASTQVARDIQAVAESTEVQTRAAAETARAVEEMAVGIERIAGNTAHLAELSSMTSQQADIGKEAMQQLVTQMDTVQQSMHSLSRVMGLLAGRSQEIAGIADNITSFAKQTNILSLNASIEAARAGEAGRGFLVVAQEIRKLAEGSLESADHIQELVTGTSQEIDEAAAYMDVTVKELASGSVSVQESSDSFHRIASAVTDMTSQLQENSAIAEQMSAGSEQISASLNVTASAAESNLVTTESVAAATQEQLALMDGIASSAAKLQDIVGELDGAIARFKI
ncbi:methyl-accepting chemotaxis protein [Paenibacillus daejeonensis]|uniref:methyl-accepting chemotaxis protein n=1 Tax=Paenibacillus daejeonensis TaxID=135193 RepID=UPI00036959E8|nr:HAMP domain-containing methyl-accepting chemotaxis protein [Paenibacillus daejeonensis]